MLLGKNLPSGEDYFDECLAIHGLDFRFCLTITHLTVIKAWSSGCFILPLLVVFMYSIMG